VPRGALDRRAVPAEGLGRTGREVELCERLKGIEKEAEGLSVQAPDE
jgi:hypothetical protein